MIFTALCAVLGMVIKPFLSPVFNVLTDFVRIPGGSVTAGISMLFLVFAAALIRKPGTALIAGLLQGIVSLSTGISAAAGALVLITYSLPGAVIDLVMLLPAKEGRGLKARCVIAGSAGVLAGAAATNMLYFHLQPVPFLLFYIFGILSGALGGYLAWLILQRIPADIKGALKDE